ncbi:hypothetical protein J3R30DRAFT_616878 [Lentinula aciculospora]|uniref:Uncharacterized protein n=1 Tax=Lentinula aciculospora TaxID=153920 RepID=A0A9W9DLN4_9AGAR|nr:hypothetical protein J3R30DRAFT_616878 [Lentinula aciculospora]
MHSRLGLWTISLVVGLLISCASAEVFQSVSGKMHKMRRSASLASSEDITNRPSVKKVWIMYKPDTARTNSVSAKTRPLSPKEPSESYAKSAQRIVEMVVQAAWGEQGMPEIVDDENHTSLEGWTPMKPLSFNLSTGEDTAGPCPHASCQAWAIPARGQTSASLYSVAILNRIRNKFVLGRTWKLISGTTMRLKHD